MTRRPEPVRQTAKYVTFSDRIYRISEPLGSTPAHATCRLSLHLTDSFPASLGNAHIDVADKVVRAFNEGPSGSVEDMMKAANLHLVFDEYIAANGRCRIFARKNARGERMSGEITVADTFVGYLAPRKRALVHFDSQDIANFPEWLKTSWRDRAVAAAIAGL